MSSKKSKESKKKFTHIKGIGDVLIKRKISGTVNPKNNPTKTSVRVFNRKTHKQLGSTVPSSSGDWEIYLPNKKIKNKSLYVICFNEGGEFNAEIYDRISPTYELIKINQKLCDC